MNGDEADGLDECSFVSVRPPCDASDNLPGICAVDWRGNGLPYEYVPGLIVDDVSCLDH